MAVLSNFPGTKNGDTGWFPSNYVDTAQEQMYSRPDVFVEPAINTEPLEIVITLYPFSTTNHEELSFEKDER